MGLDRHALRRRACLVQALRTWFSDHGYVEVCTPSVVPSPALEASLVAFDVVDVAGVRRGSLRTSPELALKRVLAEGLPRIVEIGPCFRADEHGDWHRAEFTMCEWYRAGACLSDLMDEVESLVAVGASALGVSAPTEWRRATVRQLMAEHTGIDLARCSTQDLSDRDDDWDTAFFRRWIEDVEPHLQDPLFVSEYPASQAALATVRTDGDWAYAERFEVFMGGVELANAFQELRDPVELRRRWAASTHPVDEAFLSSVARMPYSAGIALGVDRLLAVLCGWDGIGRGLVGRPN